MDPVWFRYRAHGQTLTFQGLFELFPTDLHWSDVLTALVNAVPKSIQAAIADLANPANYQILPLWTSRVDAAGGSGLHIRANRHPAAVPAFETTLFTTQLEAGNLLGAIGDPLIPVAIFLGAGPIADAVAGTLLNIENLIP